MSQPDYLAYVSSETLHETAEIHRGIIRKSQEALGHITAEIERRQGTQAHEASAVESLRVLVSATHSSIFDRAIFELADEIKALHQEIQIIKEPCWTPPQPEEKPKREYTDKDGCTNCANTSCPHFGSQRLTALCGGHVWMPW